MLNNAPSRSLAPSGYYKLRRQQFYRVGRRKHTKQKSFKERYFPFHRLPREIIAEIFVLCLPDFEDNFDSVKSIRAAPLLLCNVSSSWRSLAFSIPRLWNELSIRIMNPSLNINLTVAMLESWIARSGELPLSLRLHAYPWNERGEAMTKMHLDTFFLYASRWESVDIQLSVSAFSFPKPGPTPFLRRFLYSMSGLTPDSFSFTSCPLLSALSLPFSYSPASNPEIPWHQLTHITMETSINTQEALDILRICEMLVEFNVEISGDLGLDQVHPLRKPVKNQSLRSFYICVYITCSVLLQSLTLPALTDFSLTTDSDSFRFILTRSVHAELLGLFTRSKCKLDKLDLEDCGFDDADILNCFQHNSCSSLTKLKIANDRGHPMFTDRVILALTNKDNLEVNNVLLPKLSRLLLDTCVSASPGVLGDMILSRCLGEGKIELLQSFNLLITGLDNKDRRYLKAAEILGLDVYITTFKPGSESEFVEDQSDTDSDDS